MKKKLFVLFALALCILLSSCTSNTRARHWGGNMNVNLPQGQKLMMATWKENNLWYLTEPAEEGYVPKEKVFQEDSRYGIVEGSIIFIEH